MNWYKIALWSFILIFSILLSVWYGVYMLNISPLYTYFRYPAAPGETLTNFRNNFDIVTIRMAVFGNVFALCFLILLNAKDFRDQFYWNVLWFVLYGISFFFVFMGFIGLTIDYSTANGQGQFGNIANDPLYCCPADICNVLDNGCPNFGQPCTTGPVFQQQLAVNGDFLGLYWIHFVLMLLEAGYAAFFLWYVFGVCGKPRAKQEVSQEEPEKPTEPDKSIPLPQTPAEVPQKPVEPLPIPVEPVKSVIGNLYGNVSKPLHGLRKRK